MKRLTLSFILSLLIFSAPAAYALDPLVPESCQSGSPANCGVCQLAEAVQNFVNLLTTIATPIAVIFLLYSGFVLIMAGANPSGVGKAKTIATSAIVGLTIVMCSWIIVNTLLTVILPANVGTWYDIDCSKFNTFNVGPR